jgi:putative acetyltransferase
MGMAAQATLPQFTRRGHMRDQPAATISVERVRAATDEVRALVGELDRELAVHYSEVQRHGLTVEAIFEPHVRFFVAWRGGSAVGCGGVALFADFAELKRMFVRAGLRGQGVADAILARVAQEASDAGRALLRLETGIHQPAAIRFYERNGFRRCGRFGQYAAMAPQAVETSLFFERQLGLA